MMSKTRYILGRPCTPVLLLVSLAMIFAAGPHSAFGTTLKHRATSTGKRQHAPRRRKPAAQAHAAVIGGLSASAGSFPALAYITGATSEEEGFACTGTVVASNLILTAAHCAENVETGVVDEPAGYTVVTGTLNRDAASRQVSTVSRVIVYPGFVPSPLYGDAALLVLTAPTTAPAARGLADVVAA